MPVSEKTDWCGRCGKERLFRRHEPEHWLHLGLSIVSGGWWLPVWLYLTLFRGPFRCSRCGEPYRAPATPSPSSAWLLPFAVAAFGFMVLGVGAGRWFWRDDPPGKKPPPQSLAVSTPTTDRGEHAGIPAYLSAADLRHAFQENAEQAEARFGQGKLTVYGDVRLVPPSGPGGQAWLVFVDSVDEPLAQCLVPRESYERFEARFGERPTKATLRCEFLRYSAEGSLTLHRPELVVD